MSLFSLHLIPFISISPSSPLVDQVTALAPFTTGHPLFAECLRHSAKLEIHSTKALPSAARQKINRQIGKEAFAECFLLGTQQSLCRVLEKHSAKIYTRQNENTKNPKIIANFFFGGRPPPASARPSPSKLLHFFAQNSRITWPAGFELTTSPSCVCCSTTALHRHLCLDFVIYLHILY